MKRLVFSIFLIAALVLLPSCGTVGGGSGEESAPGSEDNTPGAGVQTEAHTESQTGAQTSVQSSGTSASWAAVTRIGPVPYTGALGISRTSVDPGWITPGDVIGVNEWNTPKRRHPPDAADNITIHSTVFEEGADIYEWTGFDPSFRICGYDESGRLVGQQRIDDDFYKSLLENGLTVGALFGDFTENITAITINGFERGNEKGRIDAPSVIDRVLTIVSGLEYTEEAFAASKEMYKNSGWANTIVFEYSNGFSEQILLHDSGLALFGGFISVPDEAVSLILGDAIVFSGEK